MQKREGLPHHLVATQTTPPLPRLETREVVSEGEVELNFKACNGALVGKEEAEDGAEVEEPSHLGRPLLLRNRF